MDNLDLNKLLSMLNSDDLMENVNRLSKLMGNPEQGDKVKNLANALIKEKTNKISQVSTKAKHEDPAINLLMAITPFLSYKRQAKLEQYLNTMNMTYVLKNLNNLDE